MSRRNMLKGIGIAGAAIAVSPAVLAACGDDSGSSAATTAGGGGAATTAAGGAATTGGAASGDVGATLAKLLEIDAATSGAGMEFKMGDVLALTGTGSFYGKTMTRGLDLAAKHIEAAGGPKINVIYHDHKSGDAAAGKQAITELGASRLPAKFASYVDDLGAMLDGTAQYKIFTLDGGGGTSIVRPGQAVLLGHPGHHAQRPAAGSVQVDEGDLPRRQDDRARSAGTSASRTTASSRPTSSKKIAAGRLRRTTACTSSCRSAARTSRRCSRRSRPTSPTSCSSASTARTPARSPTRRSTAGLKAHALGFEFTPDGVNASKGTLRQGRLDVRLRLLRRRQPEEPAGQVLRRRSSRRSTAATARLLRRQLLREHLRDVGGHPPGAGRAAATSTTAPRSTRRCRTTSPSSASTAATTPRSAPTPSTRRPTR